MQTGQQQFSLLERFVVVAIILLVSAMVIQNVLHSVKVSEERSLNNAAVEFAAVKSMYADQRQPVLASAVSANATGAATLHATQAH
jgi:type II secretory pathway pseudopilin PulG